LSARRRGRAGSLTARRPRRRTAPTPRAPDVGPATRR